jgi:hypothetical protein
MGAERKAYSLLFGKSEGKSPLRSWVGKIKMDLVDIRSAELDWSGPAQDM